MNVCVCEVCREVCAEVRSEETRHTGETGRGAGVQKKKGETEMCGVKMKKEGDREEREKPGSEAGSAY